MGRSAEKVLTSTHHYEEQLKKTTGIAMLWYSFHQGGVILDMRNKFFPFRVIKASGGLPMPGWVSEAGRCDAEGHGLVVTRQ